MTHISTLVFTLLAAFAWIIISYEDYATQRGWPVGEMFRTTGSAIKIASVMALPASILSAIYLEEWWSAIVVIIGGFFVALILTNTLRQYVQPVSILGLTFFWVTGVIILSHA